MRGDILVSPHLCYSNIRRRDVMKMPLTISDSMFAPCGMNCLVCYKHCFVKKPCPGCSKNDNRKPEHCRKCKIKGCTKSKGITYCYECAEFPCKLIRNLEKSYNKRYQESLIKNSDIVKQVGLTEFMILEKEKWTCAYCGGVISLHDHVCGECEKSMETPSGK